MARELLDALSARMAERAEARAPEGVRSAMDRFGWTTHDLARRLDVSERTARRYRQQDRIPARRAEAFRRETRSAAATRQRDRIGRRGLSGLRVLGIYYVSTPRNRYRTHPDTPVRALEGSPIPGATMREVFELQDRGEADEANSLLETALSEAYGVGEGVHWESVDGLDYTVR